jgi:hypothetical protein
MHRTRNSVTAISSDAALFCTLLFCLRILVSASGPSRLFPSCATELGSKMVAARSAFVRIEF